jgi:hypothetical protein
LLLRSLARLRRVFCALIHLSVLSPGLLILTDVFGRALAPVSRPWSVRTGLHPIADRGIGLRAAHLITSLAVAGGRSFDTAFVH